MTLPKSAITITLLLASFGLTSQLAFASQYTSFSHSSISSFFQQSAIVTTFQDSAGIIWVGTQKGLYRYDGAEVTVFNSQARINNRIPASSITGIDEDIDGNLIVATFGAGILAWDKDLHRFERVASSESRQETLISHLVVTESGHIWVGSKYGISGHDIKLGHSLEWASEQELPKGTGQPFTMVEGNESSIFVSTESGLYKISSDSSQVQKISLGNESFLDGSHITALEFDASGTLYAGTNSGRIFRADLQSNPAIAQSVIDLENSRSVSSLLLHKGRLWIGTNQGLSLTDSGLSEITTFTNKNSDLPNDHITSLSRIGESIWVGTAKGLSILSPSPFTTYNEKNSGIFDDVLAFEEDSDGKIWIGTHNGLYLFDSLGSQHHRVGLESGWPAIKDQRVMTIASKGSELWLGFRYGGLQILNTDKASKEERHSGLPDPGKLAVTKILHAKNGSTWIGTYNSGLFRAQADRTYSFLADGTLPEASTTLLLELPDGGLLVGTENSIYHYNSSTDDFNSLDFYFDEKIKNPLILAMNMSPGEDVWIGTKDHGLFLWPREARLAGNADLSRIGEITGPAASTTIYGIEFDAQDNVWCSTQSGVIKFNSRGELLGKFTVADGLQGNDFNFGASFTDKNGQVYFGGLNGYSKFYPHQVHLDLTPPKMLLTDIFFPGKEEQGVPDLSELEGIQLGSDSYFITFAFSVLDFLDPEKNQFRYKLENFDPDWIDNGTRNTATYTNLPAGDYVFRVQGANASGVWNRDGLALDINVLPAPWFTWWAYCFYGLVIAALSWISKRAYDSYAVEQRALQMATAMHEAENRADDEMQEQLELQDELVRSANRHNAAMLALVGECIAKQNIHLADELARDASKASINRISALAMLEDCLYYQSGELLADLHKYTDIVTSELLKSSPVSQESIITINEVSSRLLAADLASPVAIILYELMENSIQHAFETESLANYIHVIFTHEPAAADEEPSYQLTFSDSGIGIPDDIQLDPPETSGLAIVRTMAERLSATVEISREKGTTIALAIPEASTGSRPER